MEERHLVAAMRYVERNPVEAGMVKRAQDYVWSSAKAHVMNSHDPLLESCYLAEQIKDWSAFLQDADEPFDVSMEKSMRTGRPLGSDAFVGKLEKFLGCDLQKKRPGPKPRKTSSLPAMTAELPLN